MTHKIRLLKSPLWLGAFQVKYHFKDRADLDIIRAIKRPVGAIDSGFVGDISRVNAQALVDLIGNGAVPVIAPITHDGKGSLLNTNADTIASELATTLCARYELRLIYCFEKPGVLRNQADEKSVIPEIDPQLFEELKAEGVISDGMIPKLESGFNALRRGVTAVVITNAQGISGGLKGTRLVL
jgi:acetylglutamate kinase